MKRRRPVGAELIDGGVHFRLWAPSRRRLAVVIDGRDIPLEPDGEGYFAALVPDARAGTLYRFRLDGEGETFPDPASRFQPEGPHGPSMVIDPSFDWKHRPAVDTRHAVVYEVHFGTFTPEGTYRAAIEKLPLLRETGITVLEIMPVNEFPGRFGWGYDGVDLWAPSHLYGTPDDFRAFVDAAHGAGLAVILDVVYNHFGPDGCYLSRFSKSYFTKKYENEWGEAINYDGEGSAGVREFVSENAGYWIEELRLDGLRLDATQSIIDNGGEHVIALIARRAREAAKGRPILLVAENEPQDVRILTEYGLDGMWNDDWHHAAIVALTGRREAYYTDYFGRAQEFVSMARHGFLYQGQRYSWQKNRRGTPSSSIPPHRFICYLENHDQVANTARGSRLRAITAPGRYRAMTALLLLAPQTPMLFQGQEFGATSPFLYFADHKPELAKAVAKGRREFLAQFRSMATPETQAQLAPPQDPATFEACKLDWSERDKHRGLLDLHRDLLALRRDDDAIEGAVLTDDAFVLRFTKEGEADRLLIINLGRELSLDVVPEPLLAPPSARTWRTVWSSEEPRYGGSGTAEIESDGVWRIPGHAAIVLTA